MGLKDEQKILIALGLGYYYMYYTSYETDYRSSSRQDAGGLQEWSTDQDVEAESKKDADAKKLKEKAMEEDICVPIGEGENCW